MAEQKKRGGEACSAVNCTNARRKCPGMSFFRFPKDETRCRIWVQNCRREDFQEKPLDKLYHCVVCEQHFEDSQFVDASAPKRRLRKDAVPTVFDVPNRPASVTVQRPPAKRQLEDESPTQIPPKRKPSSTTDEADQAKATSSSTPLPSELVTPRMKALKRQVKTLKNKLYRLGKNKCTCKGRASRKQSKKKIEEIKRNVIEGLSYLFSGVTFDFLKTQIRQVGRNKKGHRWSDRDKAICLSLFHMSPKAYGMLQKIFLMPSVSTLRRAMQKIRIYPGFSDNILRALEKKISSMPRNSDLCAIVFDEMSIKENVVYNPERDEVEGLQDFGCNGKTQYVANHATVFMARGLLSKWKQAIGYFLSSGPIDSKMLHTLLLQCIDKAEEAGLKVKVIIADQGSNNRKVYETFCGATLENPFFEHNGKKIYVLYDPPNLLKNIRNNFKKTGFRVGENEVKWSYIEELYEFDRQNPLRLAPKLTKKHIELPPFANLRVKFATQVLSHSVAAGLSTLRKLNVLSDDAKWTAEFVERFFQLFNAFNSGSLSSAQKMRHAISDTSGHKVFLEETLAWFATVKSLASRSALPCLSGWVMAIRTLLSLWEDLKADYNISFLLTNRLTQDCVENLFSTMRGKGGHGDNPSATQFRQFLRQAMVDSILLVSNLSNCAEDDDNFLLTLASLSGEQVTSDDAEIVEQQAAALDDAAEDNTVHLLWLISNPGPAQKDPLLKKGEGCVLTYISGYIARKLQSKVCPQCAVLLTGLTGSEDELLIVNKQLEMTTGQGLTTPSDSLKQIVTQYEASYIQYTSQIFHLDKVRRRLITLLEKGLGDVRSIVCPLSEQPCPVMQMILHVFLNIRLNFTLKDNGRSFGDRKTGRNRKLLKVSHE